MNQEGQKDEGIVAPPVEDAGKRVVEAPKKTMKTGIKPLPRLKLSLEYPGGAAA